MADLGWLRTLVVVGAVLGNGIVSAVPARGRR
jgi:hypothetical protein